jgi:hypothetical protein
LTETDRGIPSVNEEQGFDSDQVLILVQK